MKLNYTCTVSIAAW